MPAMVGCGVAALVCLAVGVRLFMATDAPTEEQMRTLQTPAEQPFEFRYERLKINDTSLYRYILTYDNTGTLALDIVDLGMDDRSYAKQKKLDADAQAALRRTVLGSGYAGIPALTPQQSTDGTLNRSTLTLAVGTEVWTRTAENTSNRAFDTYCAQLEEFARTALGAIATQYSVEELRVLAPGALLPRDAESKARLRGRLDARPGRGRGPPESALQRPAFPGGTGREHRSLGRCRTPPAAGFALDPRPRGRPP